MWKLPSSSAAKFDATAMTITTLINEKIYDFTEPQEDTR